MNSLTAFSVLLLCVFKHGVSSLKLPGPMVYVVTPSPRPPNNVEARSAPFYYHSWMRRMDEQRNVTSTTSTTTPKSKTPDLIFAEFESDHNNMKSIRKLLEKERVVPKSTTTTTSRPIYVPDEDTNYVTRVFNYGLPVKTDENGEVTPEQSETTDYFSMYNNLYNNAPAPVYLPSTSPSTTTKTPSTSTPTTTTFFTTTPPHMKVENIWHIIDNQKYDQYSGKWEEETIDPETAQNTHNIEPNENDENNQSEDDENVPGDDNFTLPGLGTNSGNGAENESRAIRTEPNIRFPYVNLKPFQMKKYKKPLVNTIANSKKTTNLMMNLDNFRELKNPVRGEAQDVAPAAVPARQPIDRYNPAQPYLPQPDYGTKSKPPNPSPPVTKVVANLVPPPSPPVPKITGDDFPFPTNYESFPPYAPSGPASNLAPPPSASKPKPAITMYQLPVDPPDTLDDSGSDSPPPDDVGHPTDLGYRYKQPSLPSFLPTLPPAHKPPFSGYSYDKPSMTYDSPPVIDEQPEFHGYHYNKPEAPPTLDHPPASYGDHDSEYPELIFDHHHGVEDTKEKDYSKDSDMGMAPPPPPYLKPDHGPPMDDSPPTDNHGFPHDFPGDLKLHQYFDNHDDEHDHHYHYHEHTTTTTTEMPRVNRYSYYYLGKKLYYLPLYFSVYFIVYVGALIIKAVLRHKIVYPNSWRPNDTTASFFSKRSVDSWDLHEITGKVTHAIANAADRYMEERQKEN